MASPIYPVTGCGLPRCRTCHPDLIPEPHEARWVRLRSDPLTLRQIVGAIVGGVLAFCAVYVILVLFLTVTS